MRAGLIGRLQGAGTPFEWPIAVGHGRAPFASFPAGPAGCVAGPQGVVLGIFGWVDRTTLQVSNVQAGGAQLGFVLPTFNMWNLQRVKPQWIEGFGRQLLLRPGLECVVAVAGDFLTQFPLGGQAGSQVFADPATGIPYANNPGGLVATPWTLMQNGGCNAQLRISSFVKPVN